MTKEKIKRVALYARVSTVEKGQDPETQVRQLREYALARNFQIIGEYVDYASDTTEERAQYKAMLKAARRRRLDMTALPVLRKLLINALKEFQSLSIDFISYQENIDTTTPTRELIFHVMASLAQFESSLISLRVKAGMARAKAQGKANFKTPAKSNKITTDLRATKNRLILSMNQISIRSGVAYGTVYNYLAKKKH